MTADRVGRSLAVTALVLLPACNFFQGQTLVLDRRRTEDTPRARVQ